MCKLWGYFLTYIAISYAINVEKPSNYTSTIYSDIVGHISITWHYTTRANFCSLNAMMWNKIYEQLLYYEYHYCLVIAFLYMSMGFQYIKHYPTLDK